MAAIAVSDNPNAVELALGADMAPDGLYQLTLAGVPGADTSTCTTTSVFRTHSPPVQPGQQVVDDDFQRVLYGVDLVWSNGDYQETAAGDLATRTGPDLVQAAAYNGALSDGLPWDDTFGAKLRGDIDAPILSLTATRAKVLRQFLSDDRVARATVTFVPDFTNPGTSWFDCRIQPVADPSKVIAIQVPLKAQ